MAEQVDSLKPGIEMDLAVARAMGLDVCEVGQGAGRHWVAVLDGRGRRLPNYSRALDVALAEIVPWMEAQGSWWKLAHNRGAGYRVEWWPWPGQTRLSSGRHRSTIAEAFCRAVLCAGEDAS